MLKKFILLYAISCLSNITIAQTLEWEQVWREDSKKFEDTIVKPYFRNNNIFYTGEIKILDTTDRYLCDEHSPRLIDFYTKYQMVKKDKDFFIDSEGGEGGNTVSFGINHLGRFTYFYCGNWANAKEARCGFYREGNIASNFIDDVNMLAYYPNGELEYKRMGDEIWDTVNVFKYPNGALKERIDFYPIDTFVSNNPKDCNLFCYARASDDSLIYKEEDLNKYGITWGRHISYRILEGRHQFGYDNYAVKLIGHYKNNQRDGEWVYYNEKGKLLRKEIFQNGKKIKCKPCGDVSDFVYLTLFSFHPDGREGPIIEKYKAYEKIFR